MSHARKHRPKTTSTERSPSDHGGATGAGGTREDATGTGSATKFTTNHANGMARATKGTPTSIQSRKRISRPAIEAARPANTAFGAVPTSVATPPIEQA